MLGDTSVPSRVTNGAESRASRWYIAQCPHTASPAAFTFVQFWHVHAGRGADVGEAEPSDPSMFLCQLSFCTFLFPS